MNRFQLDINGRIYKEFDKQFLEKSIEEMLKIDDSMDNFLILDAKSPVDNSIYMQTMYENGIFHVEVRFSYSDDSYKHYLHKTNSAIEVKELFLDYYLLEKVPDISVWEDISSLV